MRWIKLIITGVIGLFIVVTLISLLIPSEIKVSRAVIIHAGIDKISEQVEYIQNWKNWHPMFFNSVLLNPLEVDGKIVSCDIIRDENVIHFQVIKSDSSHINFLVHSNDQHAIENEILLVPVTEKNAIMVEWRILTRLHWYPWEKFYGIFIDRLTGAGYEKALNNLKDFVERN